MLWGERARRRRVVVGLLVLFAVADIVFALAVMREGSGAAAASVSSLPLHPIAGSFKPDGTQLSECSDDRCFQQAFGNISYRQGPKAALALVDNVYGNGASQSCHRIVHAIGAAALARFGNDIPKTFAKGSAICGSGYYHGVLERALVKVRSREPATIAPVARRLCASARKMTPWIEYQCLHGLGHGLMIATGLDLPICARRLWASGEVVGP